RRRARLALQPAGTARDDHVAGLFDARPVAGADPGAGAGESESPREDPRSIGRRDPRRAPRSGRRRRRRCQTRIGRRGAAGNALRAAAGAANDSISWMRGVDHMKTLRMCNRRRFLEIVSGVPLLGRSAKASRSFLAAGAPILSAGAPTLSDGARGFGRAAPPSAARDYFRELGVRPFINAAGTYTAMTASLMPREVIEAINYASKHYVMLDELHDKVGERIATLVHSEAAMVTAGAASALTLGTAAVLTGMDRQKMVDLPDLAGMKSEVIIQKAHRFGYDHAVRNCGVRLVEVETREDVEQAINDKTAMMLFYNNNNKVGRIQDEEFVELGKKHSVPTFNDAAADVPPVDNLWKYTKMGFDLVTFSGGKGIRGPQSAGLLLGRRDLIAAARLNAPPNGNTIGRGLKVNKEE